MTFREKLLQEHPELKAKRISMVGCPFDYGLEASYNCKDPTCRSDPSCRVCWSRAMPGTEEKPHILDSGERRQFETGAVRDIQEGKGRCDLMPLRVLARIWRTFDTAVQDIGVDKAKVFDHIAGFQDTGDTHYLELAIHHFVGYLDYPTAFLEVAKHFEEGAKKYGENNWQKGLPANCYIDSAVRHYLKWLRGDKDEPHDRAFVWNLMCCIWEVDFSPRAKEKDEDVVPEIRDGSSYFLTPEDTAVTLAECPVGLFEYNGTLGMKTEYMTQRGPDGYVIDAYIVSSGERFCIESNAMVNPCSVWTAEDGDE